MPEQKPESCMRFMSQLAAILIDLILTSCGCVWMAYGFIRIASGASGVDEQAALLWVIAGLIALGSSRRRE